MAGTPSNQDVFDVRKIRRLIELMKEHDLSEIDLRQDNTRIQLRRGGQVVHAGITALPAAVPVDLAPAKAASG